MNDEPCVINVNGTTYYYPCDKRNDIILVGNSLINTGSSQIILYHSFPVYGDNSTGYPRITMPSNSVARYQSAQNTQQISLQVTSASFNSANFGYSFYLNLCIFFALILLFFKK